MFRTIHSRFFKGISRVLVTSMLASIAVVATGVITAPSASAYAASSCGNTAAGFTGGGFLITPLHGKAFYLDLKKSMNATYVGYSIKNVSGSTKNDLWLELTDFRSAGTQVIGLANPADSYQPIGTLANNATKIIYVLLKANSYSTADQTHDVRVHSGYPNGRTSIAGSGAAECYYTFSKVTKTYSVVKTLAASANKVSSISVNTTSPILGSTVVVTVKGQTGQGGSGSVSPDGDIMWLSAASNSSWPTRALRLESTSLDVKYKKGTGGKTDSYIDSLLVTGVNSPATQFTSATTYTATFTFRVLGGLTSNPAIKPVAQIASGTQIKHTGSYPVTQTTINLTGVTSSMVSSKNVVSIGALETVTGVVYRAVNYKITETDTALQTTLDKIVDDPAAGVIFKTGSAKVRDSVRSTSGGTTIPDPVDAVSGGGADHKYTFGGPFTGYNPSGTNYVIELTYTMLIPTSANATYTNVGYGMVGNTIVGRSTSSVGAAGVIVNRTSSATVDPTITTTSLPKQPQVIDFPALPTLGVGSTQKLDAVAESGLPVSYSSNTPSICSVNDGILTILAEGTCSITASQAGNDFWDPATSVTNTVSTKPGQVITFLPNETMTVSGTQTKAATSNSGLPVTLTVLTTDICSVSGSSSPFIITALAAGTCVIIASQVGDATYGPAMDVERTINVGALQAISFGSLVDKNASFKNYTVSATSKTPTTSGSNTSLPITFTSLSLDVCEITTDTTVSSGVSSVTVEGITGATGICIITASQDGLDSNGVQSAYAPATDVTQSFVVGTVPSIVVTTSVGTIASGGTLSATATITVPNSSGTLTGTVTLYVDGTRASASAISSTSVNVSMSANGTNASTFSGIQAGILAPSDPNGEMLFTATFTKTGGTYFSTSTRTSVSVVVTPPELPTATTNDVSESAVGIDTATITGSYIPKGTELANTVIHLGLASNSLADTTTAVASSGASGSGSSSINIVTLASGLTSATKYFYKTSVNRNGYQAEGDVKSFTTKPTAPTINSVTAGSTSASVAFNAITPGSGVTIAYRAVCTSSDGGTTGTVTGSNSPILVTGLTTGGKTYTCRVSATTTTVGSGGGGYGAQSSASSSFTTLIPKISRTIEIKSSTNGGVDSATSVSIFYGDTATVVVVDPRNDGTTSATKASGSACTISGFTVTSAGVGTCTFDGAVTEGATYAEAATTSPATVVVSKKTLTITASSHTVIQGAANPTLTASYSGFAFSENQSSLGGTLSCTTSYSSSSSVGSYATTCSGYTSDNYTLNYVAGSITVNPKTSRSIEIKSSTNGGVDSATSVSIVYGDTATVVVMDPQNEGTKSASLATGTACTISGFTVTSAGVGTCTFNGAVTAGTTYAAANTTTPATVVVTKKALTITALSLSIGAGAPKPSISGEYSGFVFSEGASNLSGTLTCDTTYTSSSGAGSYPTTCSGKSSDNYEITYVPGSITVSSKPSRSIEIKSSTNGGVDSSTSVSIVYGDTATVVVLDPHGEGIKSASLASGSACSLTGFTVTSTGVGTCTFDGAVTEGTTYAGAATTSPATVVVSKKTLTVTASSHTVSRGASVPTVTASYSGFAFSENESSLGGTLSCSTLYTSDSATGTYETTCSGLASDNYTFNYVAGSITVNSKTSRTIEIKASTNGGVDSSTSVSIVYGETATLVVLDPQSQGTKSATKASGLACSLSGFTVTSAGVGTCTFNGAVTEGTTYAAANTTSPATVIVTRKTLTITASSHTVNQGASTPSISATYSSFAFSESIANLGGALSCSTLYTSSSTAGSYATTCSGFTSDNYTFNYVDGSITVNSSGGPTTYTVTYSLNGGSGSTPTETSKTSGQTFTTPSDSGFSRSGYSFDSWSCNSVTKARNVLVTVGTSNMVCTAIWNKNGISSSSSTKSAAPVTPATVKKIAIASLVTIATTPVKTSISVVPSTPEPTPTPKATPSPAATPKATPTASAEPKATPSPAATPKATPTPASSAEPKATPSPAATPKATPTPNSSPEASASPAATPKATPSPATSASPSTVNQNEIPEGVTLSTTTVIPTSNAKAITFKGTGIAKVAVVNDEVSVAARPGFSGKTVVTITLKSDEEISIITANVLVIPLPVTNPVVKELTEDKTRISWIRSPNAIGYEVTQNGTLICTTKSVSCTLDRNISADIPVEIKALGKDQTESVIREATYVPAPVAVVPTIALVVNFDTNKYNLDSGDRLLIENFAIDVLQYGYKEVDISGHTDSRGGVDNNILSLNRAKASREYLLKLIPNLKVTINGYADVISVAPNTTVEGMAANRRAEFRVVK